MTLKCTMILGDCLEVMQNLPARSFDSFISDLPYCTTERKHTANHWDSVINLKKLWDQINLRCQSYSPKVFIGCMTLAVALISSNPKEYRYDLVAERYFSTGFLNSRHQPLRKHDLILLFSSSRSTYNPQMTIGQPYKEKSRRPSENYGSQKQAITISPGTRYPVSIQRPSYEPERRTGKQRSLHPTQKPVALLDWLIRTYSNEGDNVLDPTSGSGTTAVAALSCGRNVACIEKNPGYFDASVERVRKHVRDNFIRAEIDVIR